MEADATYISLQHRGKKEKEKLEVKLSFVELIKKVYDKHKSL